MVFSVHYKIIAVSPGKLHIWGRTGSAEIIPSGSLTAQCMSTEKKEGRLSVYEIGYLLSTSIPEEKIPAEAEALRAIITKAGASVIAEEAPQREQLAYTIRTKNVSGTYNTYDEAYFGWVKFELTSDVVEAVKKAIEILPSVIRMILITTVKEPTYLGKRAPAVAAAFGATIVAKKPADENVVAKVEEKPVAASASVEEMDKSIEEMVKEVN